MTTAANIPHTSLRFGLKFEQTPQQPSLRAGSVDMFAMTNLDFVKAVGAGHWILSLGPGLCYNSDAHFPRWW
jgi:hypothetical protein